MRHFSKQSGFSLIEILVTVLVLGIGLLGVAALQVSSISSNQEGLFTSQATSIAEDLASKIRASKSQIMALGSNNDVQTIYSLFTEAYAPTVTGVTPAVECPLGSVKNCAESTAVCTTSEIATFDKYEACRTADDALPNGKIRIIKRANRMTLVVDWDSAQGRQDIGTLKNVNTFCQTHTGSSERNCIFVEILP